MLIEKKRFTIAYKKQYIESTNYFIQSKDKKIFYTSKDDSKEFLIENLVDEIELDEERAIFIFALKYKIVIVFKGTENDSIEYNLKKSNAEFILNELRIFLLFYSDVNLIYVHKLDNKCEFLNTLIEHFTINFLEHSAIKPATLLTKQTANKKELALKNIIFMVSFFLSLFFAFFTANLSVLKLDELHLEKKDKKKEIDRTIQLLQENISIEEKRIHEDEIQYKNTEIDKTPLPQYEQIKIEDMIESIKKHKNIVVMYGKIV